MRIRIIILIFFQLTMVVLSQQFTKLTDIEPVLDQGDSRAVNWIDFNADGALDLFFTNGPSGGQNNFLYIQSGDGSFHKVSNIDPVQDNAPSDGSTWGDYDNDFYPDLFVVNWYNRKNLLYHNNANSTLSLMHSLLPSSENSFSETASWGDIDNDGFLDLYVCNSGGTDKSNFLYLNNGDGRFSKIVGGEITDDQNTSRNINWIDINEDWLIDAFVTNEGNENNSLYINNGEGIFVKNTTPIFVNDGGDSFGSSWGDIDNDGDLDLFVANWGNQKNFLYINNGLGDFTKVTDGDVVNDNSYSIGSDFGDIDNDGDLDLFVANGFSGSSKTTNLLYLNNGEGIFTRVDNIVTQDEGWSYGASFGDMNRDGYLDLAVAKCYNANENNAVYLNNGGTNNWLHIRLNGSVSNRSAIGTIVKLKANIFGKDVWQMRVVSGQSGYCGQNLQVHFGLGDATSVDSIIVEWPSNQIETVTDIPVNTFYASVENLPPGFIRANFKADTISGESNLAVQFTDISITSSPITGWQWDFNNDGQVDSEERNPSWNFTSDFDASYSVKLTVTTATGSQSKIREGYINMTGFLPEIQFDTEGVALGDLPTDSDPVMLEYMVYNNGAGADSIFAEIDYRNVNVPDALTISPAMFEVAAMDSQKVMFNIYPDKLEPKSSLYAPRIVLTSKRTQGENVFEKPIRFKVVLPTLVDNGTAPFSYNLSQNYPNPFNPVTKIVYSIGTQRNDLNTNVIIKVFDILGDEITTLVNESKSPGNYEVDFNADLIGGGLHSGVYFYTISAGVFSETKKMILIK